MSVYGMPAKVPAAPPPIGPAATDAPPQASRRGRRKLDERLQSRPSGKRSAVGRQRRDCSAKETSAATTADWARRRAAGVGGSSTSVCNLDLLGNAAPQVVKGAIASRSRLLPPRRRIGREGRHPSDRQDVETFRETRTGCGGSPGIPSARDRTAGLCRAARNRLPSGDRSGGSRPESLPCLRRTACGRCRRR